MQRVGGDIKISAFQTVFHKIMFLEILLDTLRSLFHLSPVIPPLPQGNTGNIIYLSLSH